MEVQLVVWWLEELLVLGGSRTVCFGCRLSPTAPTVPTGSRLCRRLRPGHGQVSYVILPAAPPATHPGSPSPSWGSSRRPINLASGNHHCQLHETCPGGRRPTKAGIGLFCLCCCVASSLSPPQSSLSPQSPLLTSIVIFFFWHHSTQHPFSSHHSFAMPPNIAALSRMQIARFFEQNDLSVTREQCDAEARRLTNQLVTATPSQGGTSYTVEGGNNSLSNSAFQTLRWTQTCFNASRKPIVASYHTTSTGVD